MEGGKANGKHHDHPGCGRLFVIVLAILIQRRRTRVK
jgi:hypothetical protein